MHFVARESSSGLKCYSESYRFWIKYVCTTSKIIYTHTHISAIQLAYACACYEFLLICP
ncbi:hypothetical protein JHK82_022162 [Glycine max]|uniref:Uncharacterized protein n=1 Tax=Glycine max TaxID=3847 RepID=K7L8A1_SOYBN|nr:hypothetical protein JHK85_022643 [Glycine max]KAG5137431.1 hypothetical protein JHK82_022162 [Glycine max]KAH1052658.1 hypothetical protein GYH30_022127 [Glycine max]KRH44773.1 hypothetical protein GLYMA_08G230300v4 [Glycine max]